MNYILFAQLRPGESPDMNPVNFGYIPQSPRADIFL